MFDNTVFEKIDSEEKAYWLGFLDADGCVHGGPGDFRIELGLAEQDYCHLEKFKNFIGKNNKISYRAQTKSYRFNFRDKKVHQDLINLGCIPQKSLIIQFPTKEQVPDRFLSAFVRGYFDGDGSFWNTDKSLGIEIISSKDFCCGLKQRYSLLNNISIYPKHYDHPQGAYRIQTGNKKIIESFLTDIYSNATIFLDRKYQKYLEYFATL